MSKRNFILLIIILIIAVALVFVFLYSRPSTTMPGENVGGTNFVSQFNPFGNSTTKPPTPTPPINISENPPSPTPEITVKLKKVSSMPIAGFIVYTKERLKDVLPITHRKGPDPRKILRLPSVKTTTKPTPPLTEFMPSLRYVDRATGNIYQTFADKIEERKFSTTVIPKIYEAFFGNKGESVIMRYLKTDGKTIETFVGNLPKEYLGGRYNRR